MQEISLFILTFTVVFICYKLFVVRVSKKRQDKKHPTEVNYLINKYKIRVDKSNYRQIYNVVAVVSSFDIALIVSLVSLTNNYFLEIILILILSVVVFLGSYHLVGIHYKQKGKE